MQEVIDKFQGKYRFLSNFWVSLVMIHSIYSENNVMTGPTAEHVYQACKSTDPDEQKFILNQETPGDAKRAGKRLRRWRPDWEIVKVSIMYEVIRAKFTQNAELGQQLIDTKDILLIEGNTWGDTFWGVFEGRGFNILGQLLMIIRKELRWDT